MAPVPNFVRLSDAFNAVLRRCSRAKVEAGKPVSQIVGVDDLFRCHVTAEGSGLLPGQYLTSLQYGYRVFENLVPKKPRRPMPTVSEAKFCFPSLDMLFDQVVGNGHYPLTVSVVNFR